MIENLVYMSKGVCVIELLGRVKYLYINTKNNAWDKCLPCVIIRRLP